MWSDMVGSGLVGSGLVWSDYHDDMIMVLEDVTLMVDAFLKFLKVRAVDPTTIAG